MWTPIRPFGISLRAGSVFRFSLSHWSVLLRSQYALEKVSPTYNHEHLVPRCSESSNLKALEHCKPGEGSFIGQDQACGWVTEETDLIQPWQVVHNTRLSGFSSPCRHPWPLRAMIARSEFDFLIFIFSSVLGPTLWIHCTLSLWVY